MDDEKKRPVLQSSEALKGNKAKARKKRPKWPLLVLLLLVAGGLWAAVNRTTLFQKPAEPEATAAPSTKVVLIGKAVKDFDQVTITGLGISPSYTIRSQIDYDEEGKEIEKPEGAARYLVVGDPSFALNDMLVDRMLQSATSITAQSTVIQDAQDLSVYGLAAPQLTAHVVYKDGTKATLNIGDKMPTGLGYYMNIDDQKTVYAVSTTPYTDFNRQLNELHVVKQPPAMDPLEVKKVLIEQTDKPTIELEQRDPTQAQGLNALWMQQPYEIEAHMTRGNELVDAITKITIAAYAGHADTPEELAKFGLDSPAARVVYEQNDGAKLELSIGAQADDSHRYCTLDGSGDVYTVETGLLSFLADATPALLVDQFAGLVNIKYVDTLTVTGQGAAHELGIKHETVSNEDGTETDKQTFFYAGQPAEEKPFKTLYQEIIGMLFDKFRPENDTIQPGATPLATVTFKLNNGQPDRVIEYLPYDDDYCLIQDGDRALFLIKKQKVENMLDMCAAFAATSAG